MNSKIFQIHLLFILFTSSLFACEPDSSEPEAIKSNSDKPNIILIIADDMGLDATPGYDIGSIKPKMPNLAALQNAGLTFTNFTVNPLCSPTRASIISGKYGYKTGVLTVNNPLPSNEIILQKFINQNTQNAYSTAVIGKWHLAGNTTTFNPETLGIDYFAGILSGGLPSYTDWTLREDGGSIPQTTYATEKFTDLAKSWVSNQKQPFFLWLAYNAPHAPFHVPPSQMHSQGNLSSNQADINANPLPYYLASIEAMDYQIGRLLAPLTAEQKANTIIIFIGDNGTPNQVAQEYSRNRVKNTVYQGGINTAMVISGKNVERKGYDNSLINSTDLFATIASLCGIKIEKHNDSINFSSLFSEAKSSRNFAYSEVNDGSIDEYMVRDLKNKLIIKTDKSEEFYDLVKDPLETNNLNEKLSKDETLLKKQLQEELLKIRIK
jgi:arylsulfatase B